MKRQKDLEENLNVLENVIDDNPTDENTINEILHTKEYLNEIYEEQTRGAHICCKVKWYEEGEKSTKYFLNKVFQNIKQKLIVEQSEELEGMIIEAELLTALKSTPNGKSPGSYGFTVEFYKFFWKNTSQLVLNSINMGFDSEEMSITQTWYNHFVAQKDKTYLN